MKNFDGLKLYLLIVFTIGIITMTVSATQKYTAQTVCISAGYDSGVSREAQIICLTEHPLVLPTLESEK